MMTFCFVVTRWGGGGGRVQVPALRRFERRPFIGKLVKYIGERTVC